MSSHGNPLGIRFTALANEPHLIERDGTETVIEFGLEKISDFTLGAANRELSIDLRVKPEDLVQILEGALQPDEEFLSEYLDLTVSCERIRCLPCDRSRVAILFERSRVYSYFLSSRMEGKSNPLLKVRFSEDQLRSLRIDFLAGRETMEDAMRFWRSYGED